MQLKHLEILLLGVSILVLMAFGHLARASTLIQEPDEIITETLDEMAFQTAALTEARASNSSLDCSIFSDPNLAPDACMTSRAIRNSIGLGNF